VIDLLDSISFSQNFFSNHVEIFNPGREPRSINGPNGVDSVCNKLELIDSLLNLRIRSLALQVHEEVDLPPVVVDKLLRFGLDSSQVDVVLSEDIQSFVQDSVGLTQSEDQARSVLGLPN
jgi:hypothetical protein